MTKVQEQIVRTYSGQTRDAALEAYRVDAARAIARGYAPISHRWTEATTGPTLIVAFGQVGTNDGPAAEAPAEQPDANVAAKEPDADVAAKEPAAEALPTEAAANETEEP